MNEEHTFKSLRFDHLTEDDTAFIERYMKTVHGPSEQVEMVLESPKTDTKDATRMNLRRIEEDAYAAIRVANRIIENCRVISQLLDD